MHRLSVAFFSDAVFAATCGLKLAVIASFEAPCPDAPFTLCERIIDWHPKSVMLPDERVLPSGLR